MPNIDVGRWNRRRRSIPVRHASSASVTVSVSVYLFSHPAKHPKVKEENCVGKQIWNLLTYHAQRIIRWHKLLYNRLEASSSTSFLVHVTADLYVARRWDELPKQRPLLEVGHLNEVLMVERMQ